MISLTIVHGNDDVVKIEHATVGGALADATVRENERHGTENKSLRQLLPEFEITDAGRGFQQFGTNHHYVVIEERP